MTKLRISDSLSLPLDGFVTSTQMIVAKKRRGKSYLAQVQAEELLAARQQVVALDPTGAWWGLRSSADGKEAGYSIVVFGGDHADVPLAPTSGETVAEAIVSEAFSAVLDLTSMRKGERIRFGSDFLETLYRRNRAAMHLFVDEADVFAPQVTRDPQQARLLGATDELVRRGGLRGVGVTLITQRSQVVSKDVISQIDAMAVLQMNHPKDIAAVRDWMEANYADKDAINEMLRSLPRQAVGTAWYMSPERDLFAMVPTRRKRTFDSGRTPKPGERVVAPKVLAPVDLARLGRTISESVEQAKANDPKLLKARIAELEKQIAKPVPAAKVETKTVEKPVIKEAQLQRIGVLIEQGERLVERFVAASKDHIDRTAKVADQAAAVGLKIEVELGQLRTAIRAPNIPAPPATPTPRPPTRTAAPVTIRRENVSRNIPAGNLPVGEAATLRALIHYASGLRREQLTVLTGYKRSTRDAYIQRLREKGFCEVGGDRVVVTSEGVQAMPDAEPLPTGDALQSWWLPRLPAGEGVVLKELIRRYPGAVERDAITEETGYKRSTRDAYLQRLAAKELVVDLGRGAVKASDTLFEVAS